MIRFTTAGESHGKGLVAILEGIPAGLRLLAEDVNHDLKRRMQGYGRGARMKIEADAVEFLSGVRAGETLGSPIAMLIANRDWANWVDVMAPEPDGEGKRRRRLVRPRRGTPTSWACSSTTATMPGTFSSGPAPAKPPPASRVVPCAADSSTSSG